MSTLERLLSLIKEKGLTEADFAISLGFNRVAVSDWKRGKSKSYMKKIDEIADYFDVTVDYLLGRTDDPQPRIRVMREGEDDFSDATSEERKMLRSVLEAYRKSQKKE